MNGPVGKVASSVGPPHRPRWGGWLPVALFSAVTAIGLAGFVLLPAASSPTVPTVPTGPGATVTVADEAGLLVTDTFDGDDGTAGQRGGLGPDWTTVSGQWILADGVVALVAGAEQRGAPAMVVTQLESADGWVAADAAAMAAGWGLVYRFEDQANYSYVVAYPPYASYRLARVTGGVEESLAVEAPLRTRDGVVVRVDFIGPDVTLFVDGSAVLTAIDDGPHVGTAVGLLGQPSSVGVARWDRLRAGVVPS